MAGQTQVSNEEMARRPDSEASDRVDGRGSKRSAVKAAFTGSLLAGAILGTVEAVWMLVTVGPPFVGLAFALRGLLLDGLIAASVGCAVQAAVNMTFKPGSITSPVQTGIRYFLALFAVGLMIVVGTYLVDIRPLDSEIGGSVGLVLNFVVAVVAASSLTAIIRPIIKASIRWLERTHTRIWRRIDCRIVGVGVFGLLGITLLLVDFAVGCRLRSVVRHGKTWSEDSPGLMLIVLDSVRADHISCYGYGKPTTPFLDSLAAGGVLFRSTISASTWTVPSHASLFTGLYPSSHGDVSAFTVVSREVPTLAEILSNEGYFTASIFDNQWLSSETGLARGFDRAIGVEQTHKCSLTVDRLASRLGVRSNTPRTLEFAERTVEFCRRMRVAPFVFVNLLDAHLPYERRDPYYSGFLDGIDTSGIDLSRVDRLLRNPSRNTRAALLDSLVPAEHLVIQARYDSNIRYQDEKLRESYSRLQAQGLAGGLLLCIISDHGELLGEHGHLDHHTEKLYEGVLKVPWILSFPGRVAARVEDSNVSHVDVMPTLLTLLGMSGAAPPHVQGVDVSASVPQRGVLSEYWIEERRAFGRAYYEASSKLHARADGKLELYDVAADPREEVDLAALHPETAALLAAHLRMIVEGMPRFSSRPRSDGEKDRLRMLRSLGYLN